MDRHIGLSTLLKFIGWVYYMLSDYHIAAVVLLSGCIFGSFSLTTKSGIKYKL